MADIHSALQAKRKADWDHTAMVVLAVQRSAGNKKVQFTNPYAESDTRKAFKQFVRNQQK